MAYRVKQSESLCKNLKRIAHEQIDKAIQLACSTSENDDALHDIRKCVKRIRAVLRLVRSELGQSVYTYENNYFRNAGQLLTTMRDAKVVANTLDEFNKACPLPGAIQQLQCAPTHRAA